MYLRTIKLNTGGNSYQAVVKYRGKAIRNPLSTKALARKWARRLENDHELHDARAGKKFEGLIVMAPSHMWSHGRPRRAAARR